MADDFEGSDDSQAPGNFNTMMFGTNRASLPVPPAPNLSSASPNYSNISHFQGFSSPLLEVNALPNKRVKLEESSPVGSPEPLIISSESNNIESASIITTDPQADQQRPVFPPQALPVLAQLARYGVSEEVAWKIIRERQASSASPSPPPPSVPPQSSPPLQQCSTPQFPPETAPVLAQLARHGVSVEDAWKIVQERTRPQSVAPTAPIITHTPPPTPYPTPPLSTPTSLVSQFPPEAIPVLNQLAMHGVSMEEAFKMVQERQRAAAAAAFQQQQVMFQSLPSPGPIETMTRTVPMTQSYQQQTAQPSLSSSTSSAPQFPKEATHVLSQLAKHGVSEEKAWEMAQSMLAIRAQQQQQQRVLSAVTLFQSDIVPMSPADAAFQEDQQSPTSPISPMSPSGTNDNNAAKKRSASKKPKSTRFDSKSEEWTVRDRAVFRRALVGVGRDFGRIANVTGTKTYTMVKRFYDDLGGARNKSFKPLLLAHTRMKREGTLDQWSLVLSVEEEEAITAGKLVKLVQEEDRIYDEDEVVEDDGDDDSGDPATVKSPKSPSADESLARATRINLILEANTNGLFIADSFEKLKQFSQAASDKKKGVRRKPKKTAATPPPPIPVSTAPVVPPTKSNNSVSASTLELVWRREMDSILSAKWQEYLSHSQSFMHGNYRNMDDHSVATVAGVTYTPNMDSTFPFAMDANASLTFLTFAKTEAASRTVVGVASNLLKAKAHVVAKASRWEISDDAVVPVAAADLMDGPATPLAGTVQDTTPTAAVFDLFSAAWDITDDGAYVVVANNKTLMLYITSSRGEDYGKLVASIPEAHPTGRITSAVFHPLTNRIFTADRTGIIRQWSVETLLTLPPTATAPSIASNVHSVSKPPPGSSTTIKDGTGVIALTFSHNYDELYVFTKDQLRIWPSSLQAQRAKLVINLPDQGGLNAAVALRCPVSDADSEQYADLCLVSTPKKLLVFEPSRHVNQPSISAQRAVYTSPVGFPIPPAEIASMITLPDFPNTTICLQIPSSQPDSSCPYLHVLQLSASAQSAQQQQNGGVSANKPVPQKPTGSQVSLNIIMSLRYDPFRVAFVPLSLFPNISQHGAGDLGPAYKRGKLRLCESKQNLLVCLETMIDSIVQEEFKPIRTTNIIVSLIDDKFGALHPSHHQLGHHHEHDGQAPDESFDVEGQVIHQAEAEALDAEAEADAEGDTPEPVENEVVPDEEMEENDVVDDGHERHYNVTHIDDYMDTFPTEYHYHDDHGHHHHHPGHSLEPHPLDDFI